jgi:L-gulonate 5-dehydrogenase
MWAVRVEKPLEIGVVTTPDPEAKAGEVVVRIARAGICGSDIHIFHGANPFARYPRVIGHEAMGTVAALGPGVQGLSVGDRVVIDPVVSCGTCYPCSIGRTNVCTKLEVIGVHRDGGMGEYVVVPAANALRLPDNVSDRAAAMAEPYSIAANVLMRTEARAGDIALIYGAGTIGLTVLQVARMKGARCVVVDIDDRRLERATRLGAELAVNSKRDSVETAILGATDGLGPTVVIDGAGAPGILEEAVRLASPAARIGVLGFSTNPSLIPQQEITKKELTLCGSRLNRRLFPEVLQWFSRGAVEADALVTHEFDFREVVTAMRLIEEHPEETCKIHLIF